jgi:hypothetical protein
MMQTRPWFLAVVLSGFLWTTCAGTAPAVEPHPFGLTLSLAGHRDVLAAIKQINGARIQVLHPRLAKGEDFPEARELESHYEALPNPREIMIAADGLNSGYLSCSRAEFLLLDDILYAVSCHSAAEDLRRFAALRADLVSQYGRATEESDSKNAQSVEWDIHGKQIVLKRDVGGIIVSFIDTALATRAEAVRRELLANPVLLMEEMRKMSQSGGIAGHR